MLMTEHEPEEDGDDGWEEQLWEWDMKILRLSNGYLIEHTSEMGKPMLTAVVEREPRSWKDPPADTVLGKELGTFLLEQLGFRAGMLTHKWGEHNLVVRIEKGYKLKDEERDRRDDLEEEEKAGGAPESVLSGNEPEVPLGDGAANARRDTPPPAAPTFGDMVSAELDGRFVKDIMPSPSDFDKSARELISEAAFDMLVREQKDTMPSAAAEEEEDDE